MYIKGKEHNVNFIGREKFSGLVWYAFVLSAVAILASLLAFTFMGINLGIEFKGGYLLKVEVDQTPNVSEVNAILAGYEDQGLTNPIVQVSEADKKITIRMPYIEDDASREAVIQGVKSDLIAKYQDTPEAAFFEQDPETGQWVLKVYVKSQSPVSASYVEDLLPSYQDLGLSSATVETGSEDVDGEEQNYVTVRMNMQEGTGQEQAEQVKQAFLEDLGSSPYNINTESENQVGSEWGREVSRKAAISLLVFLAVILIYITFRFEFKMAVPAIVALVHDTVITVGIYALTGRQVTPATAIAFLTILGYSLYDTIVVFDRIAENANLMDRSGRRTYREMVNDSINQTLMRSIGTTVTTLLPIFTILIFGGETLKDFAFALFIGVFLGAYSSIFIASPMLAFWKETEPKYAGIKAKADKHGAREAVVRKKPVRPVAAGVGSLDDEAEETPAAKKPAAPASKPAAKQKPAAGAASKPAAGAKKKPAAKPGTKKTTKGPTSSSKKKKKKKK
jgi:preprotein translocase subunit SecF